MVSKEEAVRLIKSGVTQWGPEEVKCSYCQALWEVNKEDLLLWAEKECDQRDGCYDITVCGIVCGTCGHKTRILKMPQEVINELNRKRAERNVDSKLHPSL